MGEPPGHAADPVLQALDALVAALRENVGATDDAIARAAEIKAMRAEGLRYRDIADETGRPLVVQIVSENLDRLRAHGAALRRAQAAALHAEGMTMEQIASLFGVTRQRISAILREARTP